MTLASRISFFLICAAIVVTTLAYGAVHQPVLSLFYLLCTALVLLWAVDAVQTSTIRFSRSPFQLILAAAAVYAFIQVIPFGTSMVSGLDTVPRAISNDPFATKVNAVHALGLLIFFSALLVLLDFERRLHTLVNVVIVFGFAYAFFAILQSFLSPAKIYGIYEVRYAQPFGSFVNRHNFAAFMEMAIALPLGLLFAGAVKKDKRLLYITAASLMGVALLLSASRGGFIALVAELILLVILTRKHSGTNELVTRFGLAALLVAAVIGGAIFVGGETSLSRFADSAQVQQSSSTDRSHIWSVTLRVISANLPFGGGLGAFGASYTPFDTYSGTERVEQAHNDYLQLAADMGIVGILIGVVFFYLFFREGVRNVKAEDISRRGIAVGSFAGCFAVLVHSLFDFVLHTTAIAILFTILISLLISTRNAFVERTEEREKVKVRPGRNVRTLSRSQMRISS